MKQVIRNPKRLTKPRTIGSIAARRLSLESSLLATKIGTYNATQAIKAPTVAFTHDCGMYALVNAS
jgi:hypothetical protein